MHYACRYVARKPKISCFAWESHDEGNIRTENPLNTLFLKNEKNEASGGVVLVLSDITETEILRKKKHDASLFSAVISMLHECKLAENTL